METMLQQPAVEIQPDGELNLSNPPTIHEPDQYLKPDQDQPIKGDSGGTTFEGADPNFPYNSNDGGYGDTQNDVNGSNDSQLSTDLSQSFGEYGSIFADIIKQLESIFGDARNLAHNVNQDGNSSNPFRTWLQAISGIADKIGDGTEQTNLTNALNQMMSFYMQQISAAMENQFNIEQWQIQNDYNSPTEQLKRLSKAGLNPLHFFDSGSNGSSTSVTASSGSAPSAASAALGQTKSQRVTQGITTALGLGSTVANAALAGKQVAMQAAKLPGEIAKQAQDVVESEQRVGTARAQQTLYETEQKQTAQDTAFAQEMQPLLLKAASNNLQLQGQDMVIKGQMSDKIALESENLVEQVKLAVQDYVYKEGMNKLNQDWTKADIARTYSLAKNQDSITQLNELRANFQKSYGIPAESNLAYFMAQKVATGQWTQTQFGGFLAHIARYSAVTSNNTTKFAIGSTFEALQNFIRMFSDASTYDTEPIREYERQGQQMKTATEALQKDLNTYSDAEINAVNGK